MAKPPSSTQASRAKRQAAALRANLKRRKAAQGERSAPGPEADEPSSRQHSVDNSHD